MSIESATESIRSKVRSTASIEATVKFDCADDGVVFVDGNASPATVSNDNNESDCTIRLSLETLESLIAGDIDPTGAFMMGKIKVEGDMSIAMKLGSIL